MSTQTPRPYRLTPDGYLAPSPDGTEAYVEQALRAAKSGSAGHWPTVAAVLHDEVLRLRAEMAETVPAAQPATVDDTALIEQVALMFAGGYEDEAQYYRDDARKIHGRVYAPVLAAKATEVERLRAELADITKTAWEDRESRIKEADQLRAESAAKNEGIAVLQRAWDKARDANTAWLDGQTVALPKEWQGAITNAVYFNYGPEPKLIDQLCELIDSWRPVTEPAEATPACGCYSCQEPTFPEIMPGVRSQPFPIVCSECGNKRCPHATDHRNECTGSNEFGQVGSNYAAPCESCVLDSSGRCSRGSHNHDATPVEQDTPTRDADGWCTCAGHQELKRQSTEEGGADDAR